MYILSYILKKKKTKSNEQVQLRKTQNNKYENNQIK